MAFQDPRFDSLLADTGLAALRQSYANRIRGEHGTATILLADKPDGLRMQLEQGLRQPVISITVGPDLQRSTAQFAREHSTDPWQLNFTDIWDTRGFQVSQEFGDSAYRLLAKHGLRAMQIRTSIRETRTGAITVRLTAVEFIPGSPQEFLAMQGGCLGRAEARTAGGSDVAAILGIDLQGQSGLESIFGKIAPQSDPEGDALCKELLVDSEEVIVRAHETFLAGIGIGRGAPLDPLEYAKEHLTAGK